MRQSIAVNITISLWFSLLFGSCTNQTDAEIDFSNPDIQQIIIAQDERDALKLLPYLDHPLPAIRERAAMAFASVQDPIARPALEKMLNDEPQVAEAAAFAIGQLRSPESLPALKQALTRSTSDALRYELLVAQGRSGGVELIPYLDSLYSTKKYATGVAWSLCYLSLKNSLNEQGAELAYTIVGDHGDRRTRFGAAFALSRYAKSDATKILELLFKETEEEVKIVLCSALRNLSASSIDSTLLNYLEKSSERAQINFLKVAPASESLREYAVEILQSTEGTNLQIQAATYLSHFQDQTKKFLGALDLEKLNWRVRCTLLGQMPQPNMEDLSAIRAIYENSSNEFEKGMLLQILTRHKSDKAWIKQEIDKSTTIVATYGMESLAALVNSKSLRLDSSDLPFLIDCLWSDQDALIYYAAVLLRDSLFFSEEVIDTLTARQSQLTNPGRIEAYFAIENTFRYFSKTESLPYSATFNHPISIEDLENLQAVKGFHLKTTKGDILLEARPWEAPGTVLSMMELVNDGFYNGKLFHRTVPNFLVQTGSTEGDGWGIANLSRRSEFTRLEFTRGAAGIASLGKDTESSQWTIYHSPLPRDNGYYTVFAQVIEGMEVADQIEMGDRIIEMTTMYH